jgi:hypothetical protein
MVMERVKIDRAKTTPAQMAPAWIESAAKWLTPRRVRAQAIVLALCLWGVCAVDFATPGLLDRAGNIKFQDFLPLYVSAQLIAHGRAIDLYDQQVVAQAEHAVVDQSDRVRLPYLYGPQVGLMLVPLARFSFPVAARIWVVTSLFVFFGCVYLVWKSCPALRPHSGIVILCTLAFPPLFHFVVRGQLSAVVLACFTAAFLAFRAERHWMAGVALGFLVFKPQFLVAIPIVLLLAQAWKALAGLVVAAAAQLLLTSLYFGPAVMRVYFDTVWHISRVIGSLELSLAPIQMHSLRSFWSLLIPWPEPALALYILSSIVIVVMAAVVWKSSAPLALRFSALTFAAVLVNPHLFVYDLLVLAPALLLLVNWILSNPQNPSSATQKLLTYLAFVLPLFGPLSRWTYIQLSVPAFTMLLWVLWRDSRTPSHKLASDESAVV